MWLEMDGGYSNCVRLAGWLCPGTGVLNTTASNFWFPSGLLCGTWTGVLGYCRRECEVSFTLVAFALARFIQRTLHGEKRGSEALEKMLCGDGIWMRTVSILLVGVTCKCLHLHACGNSEIGT